MRIIFYKNTSSINTLNKNLELLKDVTCIVKNNSFNIFTPSLVLTDVTTIDGCNFCYIEELDRYYFIDKIEYLKNNLVQLNLTCDYLMTHKEIILNGMGLVTKSENNINQYASNFDVLETKQSKVLKFSDSDKFTNDKVYLLGVN